MADACNILIYDIFISDQIEKGFIKIQYCPTGQMTVDYLTKLLQGQKFHKFCAKIFEFA